MEMVWVSKSQNKQKRLTKQKYVVPIIFHEEKEAYAEPSLKEIYILNVYQIISYKFLYLGTFEEIEHKRLTRFSKYNFINHDNPPCLLGDHNFRIRFYQGN